VVVMGPGLKDACSWWGVVLLVGLVYLQATSGDTSARIVGCAVCLVAKAYGLMLGDVRNGTQISWYLHFTAPAEFLYVMEVTSSSAQAVRY